MKVLIACEFSGIVRDAFTSRGHDAWSCDLLPTERPGNHFIHDLSRGFVTPYLKSKHWDASDWWDLMIAFPPCTHLSSSGARWFPQKQKDGRQQIGIDFFMMLANAPIEKVAIENPIGIMSGVYRKPDQIIQPWMFGHGETKSTCLWLKGLPKLMPTNIVEGREGRVWKEPPSEHRWKIRSITYQGIADAMADQWG